MIKCAQEICAHLEGPTGQLEDGSQSTGHIDRCKLTGEEKEKAFEV